MGSFSVGGPVEFTVTVLQAGSLFGRFLHVSRPQFKHHGEIVHVLFFSAGALVFRPHMPRCCRPPPCFFK